MTPGTWKLSAIGLTPLESATMRAPSIVVALFRLSLFFVYKIVANASTVSTNYWVVNH